MPKYLWQASFNSDAVKGVVKEGGTSRREAIAHMVEAAGGTLEAFYFAFGDRDALIIVDAPDHATIAAASIAVNASGGVHAKTVVLLTPEEMDAAAKKGVKYTPPGH